MLDQGKSLGRYRIIELIGRGGFGSVYLAEDPWLKLPVALKVPHQQEGVFDALVLESQVLAPLNHPNIVRFMDCHKVDKVFFMVMEFVEGRSLERVVEEDGPLDLDRFYRILGQICAAVEYAHDRKVLHRDLRPANMLLAPGDVVKVTDFGIARLLEPEQSARTRIGSPAYMAPEQIAGRAVFQSDIYSVGVVMYELLTGTLPYFESQGRDRDAVKIAPPCAKRSSIPKPLSDIVMKAMAFSVEDRYQTAHELQDALRAPQPAPVMDQESMEDIRKRLHVRRSTPGAFCWNCRRPLSKKTTSCPHCGEKQS